ncbi:MAG: PepSY domain-containing protein [Eubacteriales bacterium]|nr:PepSY domain-containing protein [Eubacteriales bacterium]
MKRTLIVTLSLGLILLLAGLPAMAETSTTPATVASFAIPGIPFDQAVTLAKAAAPGYTLMSLSLEDENGALVYLAELISQTDGTKIEVTLDASSGQTITNNAAGENATENGNETADEQNGDESNVEYVGSDNGQDQGENEAADEQNGETADDTADAALLAKAVVTLTQAEEIVLNTNAGATLTGIQLEDENGAPVYSATFIDANGQQSEVKVDAVTGAILPQDNQTAEN